jgi:two-component system response regulator MprA
VRPRILVIDDESAIRDSLKMTLEYDGYDVMLAATGEEGVKLVERARSVFSTSRCRADGLKCCRSCGISSATPS